MKRRFRLIIIAFSISFTLVAALTIYALKQFTSLEDYSNQVDHTNKVITQLYEIENAIKDLDINERGFMITRDSNYISEVFKVYFNILPTTESLKQLIKEDRQQIDNRTLLRAAIYQRLTALKNNLTYIDTATTDTVSDYYFEGKKAKKESLDYLNSMRHREYNLLEERFKIKTHFQQIAYNIIQYLFTVLGILTVILFIILIRELKTRMSYQDELQNKIVDLNRSHMELEQITHAISHDLQEPLRKIQIFSDRLLYMKKDMDDDSLITLERINHAASRMHELIDDLVDLTSLIKEESVEKVNLNQVVNNVLHELDERIQMKQASVFVEALPEINGLPRQLSLLFKSLLDNALKFSKESVKCAVSIRYDKVHGEELAGINPNLATHSFDRITVADNGIGFDNKFISKMFQIFQRLHNQESRYAGKGIGLAICQRIMVNHGGYILAYGHTGIGATFKLYFPTPES